MVLEGRTTKDIKEKQKTQIKMEGVEGKNALVEGFF